MSNIFDLSPLLDTDSYKLSHFMMTPPDLRFVSCYAEPRKPRDYGVPIPLVANNHTQPFGLQALLMSHFCERITWDDVELARELAHYHGLPFNLEGWRSLVNKFMPLRIRALPEGIVVPIGVPHYRVENTVPGMGWLAGWVETSLRTWYPTTVASKSFALKEIWKHFMDITTEDNLIAELLPSRVHSFGSRAVGSVETAIMGDMAHAINFKGSDTFAGLVGARRAYGAKGASTLSIPAAEHSAILVWGKDKEDAALDHIVRQFIDKGGAVSIVSDTTDYERTVEKVWCGTMRDHIKNGRGLLVVRPDSGEPNEVVPWTLRTLANSYGHTTNTKGYEVLHPSIRVIQGDGMKVHTVYSLLDAVEKARFDVANHVDGSGDGLMGSVARDDYSFSYKASAASVEGDTLEEANWYGFSKAPKGDMSKASKAGVVDPVRMPGVGQITVMCGEGKDHRVNHANTLFRTVYENGDLPNKMTWDEVCANSEQAFANRDTLWGRSQ